MSCKRSEMLPGYCPVMPLYGLELVPGKHCPVEEMARSIAGSITTTISICSGDTGFSREMGRDVARDEQDHPLKANRKLAISVVEWERFGYQEQQSADINSEKGGL